MIDDHSKLNAAVKTNANNYTAAPIVEIGYVGGSSARTHLNTTFIESLSTTRSLYSAADNKNHGTTVEYFQKRAQIVMAHVEYVR